MSGTNPTYPAGQCTRYVADNWSDTPGPYWGNAYQWITSAEQSGFTVEHSPEIGDVAVWDQNVGGAGAAGHVALVSSINPLTVSESNWYLPLQPDIRVVSATSQEGIIGYIEPRGNLPMTLDQARGYVLLNYYSVGHRIPAQTDVDYWAAKMLTEGVETVLVAMESSPEFTLKMQQDAARDQ